LECGDLRRFLSFFAINRLPEWGRFWNQVQFHKRKKESGGDRRTPKVGCHRDKKTERKNERKRRGSPHSKEVTMDLADKVMGWDDVLAWREWARESGRVVVWTNGCFDLLHVGHVRNLRAARGLGDALVVGVNDDAGVRRLKGAGRPILPAAERAELLAALECVDAVVLFGEDTPSAALERLRPEVHCKGADYAPPCGKPIPEAAVVAAYGGRIEYLPLVPGVSTSELLRRINAGGFSLRTLRSLR
jgi:rfaE bifunctional protein nucleotidyltransferase chain/domain